MRVMDDVFLDSKAVMVTLLLSRYLPTFFLKLDIYQLGSAHRGKSMCICMCRDMLPQFFRSYRKGSKKIFRDRGSII